jgi:hypothetical protein
VERITLHLEDRMGFGVMDPTIRKKYERTFQSIVLSIETAIRGNAGDIRDALNSEAI